jgi:DNA-directed RNA polymerase specialized sigma subunit
MKLDKTAPSIDDLYKSWKTQPTQENLTSVVTALHPTINYALSSVHSANDPLVKSKALIYTAQAVQRYSPEQGASLPTFVSSHLRQLSRAARQARAPVKIPERKQLDLYAIYRAEREFGEKHGRDPDLLELADATGMSTKQIEKTRKYSYTIPAESQLPEGMGEGQGPDYQQEAMDYAYHDADYLDRKILEMKTGYGGTQTMTPKDIAVALKLTPSQLSRRSAKLTMKINSIEKALNEV